MFKIWKCHASASGKRFHRRGWARVTLALAAGLGGAVAGCPSDATRCAYVVVNVGTSATPPEDGTPVTLQAQGGQRMFITMVGGTFAYGSQTQQTSQCVPLPAGDDHVISFSVQPIPSGEATLRVDLLGQAPPGGECPVVGAGGGAATGDAGGADGSTSIDVGCPGDLLANKLVVFVAPVTTTSSSSSSSVASSSSGAGGSDGGGTGGTATTTSSGSSSASSSGNGGSDGG